jgi:uncharacterized membrane protein
MNEPEKAPLIQLLAGATFIVIGLAVFGVRLTHAGAFAMPGTGALVGGLLALLLGGLLLWVNTPRMIVWIALVVSPVAIFPAVYSIVAELEEVISLYAADSDGRVVDLRLWIVDRDDGAWVGMSRDKAIEHSLNGARLEMLRNGELHCVVPVLHEDRPTARAIHAMKVEKYAAARASAAIGLYPREAGENTVVLRLEACEDI